MLKAKEGQKIKNEKHHSLAWLLESIENQPSYLRKKMFGSEAVYLNGRLVLVLAVGEEPWNGILLPTERKFHPALQREWAPLKSHPVLGKWLYLPQSESDFEEIASDILTHIRRADERIGVEPKPRKLRKVAKKKTQRPQ